MNLSAFHGKKLVGTATALKGICISLLKALDVFDPGAILIGDEIFFPRN